MPEHSLSHPSRGLFRDGDENELTGDRFIPSRDCMNENSGFLFKDDDIPSTNYERMLAENCLGKGQAKELENMRVLHYKQKLKTNASSKAMGSKPINSKASSSSSSGISNLLSKNDDDGIVFSIPIDESLNGQKKGANRVLAPNSFRTLDAPDYLDDFYLNLVDWSVQNIVAVALGSAVFLWNGETKRTSELCSLDDEPNETLHYTSVKWSNDGNHLSLGLSDGRSHIWDWKQSKKIRSIHSHVARIGSMAWHGPMLTSGSKDFQIHNHDVRVKESLLHRMVDGFHQQEVCSLEWSPDGSTLASGGNDNVIMLTDERSMALPKQVLSEHKAAVKALAWCPWKRNFLASGAGASDQTVKFWQLGPEKDDNSTNAEYFFEECPQSINTIQVEAQVTQLRWGSDANDLEIAVGYGYSKNSIGVWKYPTMECLAELEGHASRILCMCQSPDKSVLLTSSADETLRFWRVFPELMVEEPIVQKPQDQLGGIFKGLR